MVINEISANIDVVLQRIYVSQKPNTVFLQKHIIAGWVLAGSTARLALLGPDLSWGLGTHAD